MKKKNFNFKLGDKTRDVWAGDIVTTCEYLGSLGQGRLLFYDTTCKCFRRVYIAVSNLGEPYLNGWDSVDEPSKLL
jgi:hypothetical protein